MITLGDLIESISLWVEMFLLTIYVVIRSLLIAALAFLGISAMISVVIVLFFSGIGVFFWIFGIK